MLLLIATEVFTAEVLKVEVLIGQYTCNSKKQKMLGCHCGFEFVQTNTKAARVAETTLQN